MLVAGTRLPAHATLLATILGAAPLSTAQVPEGSAVVGTNADPAVPGTPGLFLVPLAGGAMTPVTGLPPALQFAGGGFVQGVSSVSFRSSDGAIIVGTVTQAGGPTAGAVELYVLHLSGAAVAQTQTVLLGTTTNTGGVWNTILPDDRILVAGGQNGGPFPSGPMAGHLFAIVDTSAPTPTVTPLPNPTVGAGSIAGGFAVDPTGRFLYIAATANINNPSSRVASLYRMQIATNRALSIASWAGEVVQGITCDDDGMVYVSATNPSVPTHFVHTVRPNGWNPATVTSRQSASALVPAGLDLDRASGQFAAVSGMFPGYSGPQLNALSLIDPATGAVTVIASPPPGGWGAIPKQGVAVNNAIESYGACSDGQGQHHWFENFPNPGGQPVIGNAGFSLTLRSAPNPPWMSALTFSSGRGSVDVLGVEILVDLNAAVVVPLPASLSTTYTLSVPNNPALRGAVLTAQSVHLEVSGTLSASRGLTITMW